MIQYLAEGVELPLFEKRKISAWIKSVAAKYDRKVGDIAYLFCDDQKILEVNQQYLKHDYFTDIISFDYSEGKTISGDMFISCDTVKSNSKQFGTDYKTELRRVIIHGILHLCGQDDKTPELSAQMTAKENDALSMLFGTE